MRMAKGSGIDGLGGMYPSTVWAKYPQVNILRPLLEVRKADLQEVCRNEGVEWIEDSSNLSYDFVRNNIRKVLQENEKLVPEITRLVKTCQETRRHVKHLGIVASTVKFHSDDLIAVFCSLTANKGLKHINLRVDKKYGYLSFSVNRFLSLPHFVAKKVFHSLASHIGGARGPIPTKTYLQIHKQMLSRNTQTFGTCILFFPDLKKDTMIIGRALPGIWKQKSSWTPISVGQTILWDGRWRITLKSLKTLESKKAPDRAVNNKEQLYVRHMKERDHEVARRGIRKIRAAKLPPVHARAGLPVICTESGYVVLAPHFLVIDHTYGVDCDVAFEPLLPLLQDSETHVC